MNRTSRVSPLLPVALLLSACTIADADLETAAIDAFELTPAATEVGVYAVDVTVSGSLGYLVDDFATVEIQVNGATEYLESFDAAASADIAVATTVPLHHEGPNEILATLRFHGQEMTRFAVVDLTEPAATVEFPAWSTAYDQQDDLVVTAGAGWEISAVRYAVDDGAWYDAAPSTTDGAWTVTLTSLDIGDSDLFIEVESTNRGRTRIDGYRDVVEGVLPVFDCNNPAQVMEPSTTLIRDNSDEIRTLRGYFGDPLGGHTFVPVILFTNDNGDDFENGASIRSQGWTSLVAEFDVARASSAGTTSYALEMWVDGELFCSHAGFGIIRDY